MFCVRCVLRDIENLKINTQVYYIAYHWCMSLFLYVNFLYAGVHFIITHTSHLEYPWSPPLGIYTRHKHLTLHMHARFVLA